MKAQTSETLLEVAMIRLLTARLGGKDVTVPEQTFRSNPLYHLLVLFHELSPGGAVETTHELELRRASGAVGWKSSIGLPDGSSRMICLPPTPVTI